MAGNAPARRYVIEGRIVPMGSGDILDDGAIYIDDGTIEAVLPADAPAPDPKYRDGPRIRTGDTIYPGFIELHNHLSYNAMPLWEVPTRYTNNGQWRGTEAYTREITKPSQVLGQTDGAAQALVRYAECRAMLGGTTTSQGITLANAGGLTKYYRGLVRNAEDPDDPRLPRAGTRIGNPKSDGAREYLRMLGEHTCYLQHLAEGTDETARGWFQRLRIDTDTWAVTDAFCGIHCTALQREDFEVLAEAGASVVWSPLSNYLLYGATTDMAAAAATGVAVSLGCDWAPSGSKNLLGELKVAWLASREMGGLYTPRQLVEMVTVNPARALKWDGLLGSIAPGHLADLVAVDGKSGDPYELLLEARESSITLVVIGGVPRVGQPRLMRAFRPGATSDTVPGIDRIEVGTAERHLWLEHDGDLLERLPLSRAVDELTDAMRRLPQLAEQVDQAIGAGNAISDDATVAFAGGMQVEDGAFRVVPDFEEADVASAIATLGFALAAEPYAFWVTEPVELDPLTVVDDTGHLRTLAGATNLPEFVKRGLPELYGQTIPLPEAAQFLEAAEEEVDPQLLETTTDLRSLLATFGELTLDERRRIVRQATILLSENYVHLPLKRAMHAVEPVQRLRLLAHRLQEMTDATMPPEIEFHTELLDIFNSLRDLHTGYRLPRPFGTRTAWLPFLIEEIHDRGATSYILTKWVADAWPDEAMRGARVTHWNGMPIRTAMARNADRHPGSNPDARHARGVSSLTERPLARGLPPDEDWVTIRWLATDGQSHDHTQPWLVFEPGSVVGPAALDVESTALGLDDHSDDIQQTRKVLYAPGVSVAEREGEGQYLAAPIQDATAGMQSHMPGVFRAATVRHSQAAEDDPSYGYVRIFTFNVPTAEPFVDEFVRLSSQLPVDGLILDLRGNPGGLIYAAEQLLQVLTPRPIEPERAQFLNTPLNLQLCRGNAPSEAVGGLDLDPWVASMQQSVQTAATYSLGFPITDPAAANARGQCYYGPVVLITDPLCYSASDMFAAGFQDHDIGPVIGVGGATGAGGANVWSHQLLRRLAPDGHDEGMASPYEPLPGGADLRVAIRRTTRVGKNAGGVLEDLGIEPDIRYRMTRRDVMEGNPDLIDEAITHLRERRPHTLAIDAVQRHRDRVPSVRLQTTNIDRIDATADGRRLHTRDVRRNRVTLELDEVLGPQAGPSVHLEVQGFDAGELVAALHQTIEINQRGA